MVGCGDLSADGCGAGAIAQRLGSAAEALNISPHAAAILISIRTGASLADIVGGGNRAAGRLYGYPCQPAGLWRVPRFRAGAWRRTDNLSRRFPRIWRRSGIDGRDG